MTKRTDDADAMLEASLEYEATCIEEPVGVLIAEVQMVLAEKRTSLAMLRTGIAVIALPLSIAGLLVAFSSHTDLQRVIGLFIPLAVALAAMTGFGAWLVVRSMRRIFSQDRHIRELKRCNSAIAHLMD